MLVLPIRCSRFTAVNILHFYFLQFELYFDQLERKCCLRVTVSLIKCDLDTTVLLV